MSMNSYLNPDRREHLRQRAALADYGLDGRQNLPSLAAQVRRENQYRGKRMFTRYIATEGVVSLMNEGVVAFAEAAGHRLPYNLTYGSGRLSLVSAARVSDPGCYGRRLRIEEADRLIETAARFGGWLKAAAELPALRRLIKATQSERGMNSRRTTIDLVAFAARFPSPHGLERKLWAVRERAVAILTAYEGQMPSWRAIAWALLVEARVGKAAVIAVAETLALDSSEYRRDCALFRSYRAARDWLVEHRSARFSTTVCQPSNVDGLVFPLATGRSAARCGWTMEQALHVDQFGRRRLVTLATCGSRELVLRPGAAWSEVAEAFSRLKSEAWNGLSHSFLEQVSSVKNAADLLLKGWRGSPVSTKESAAALLLSVDDRAKGVCLAALVAIGQGPDVRRSLEELERELERFSDRANPILDTSDGVEAWYSLEPELTAEDGITVTRGVTIGREGHRKVIYLARSSDRTFHSDGRIWSWAGPELVCEQARRAWGQQDMLARERAARAEERERADAALRDFLSGESLGFCPFSVRRDSASAGNCSPGTEAWLRERGWVDRQWVPGVWLVPHLGDERVRRVVEALKMRLQRELRA